jgi:hypothetical protein
MLLKRLVTALVISTLFAGCAPVPVHGEAGDNFQSDYTSCTGPGGGGSGGSGGYVDVSGGGDTKAALVFVVIVASVLAITYAACEGARFLSHHAEAAPPGDIKDGVYRAPSGLYTVDVPGEFVAHGDTGIKVHESRDDTQDRVIFFSMQDGAPVYSASVVPHLPPATAALSLDEYAAKLSNPRGQTAGSVDESASLVPAYEVTLTLDGKPALFRDYPFTAGPGGKTPAHYLLYVIKDGATGALLSITWYGACPQCATGPEAEIRSMDPSYKRFVESFHLMAH